MAFLATGGGSPQRGRPMPRPKPSGVKKRRHRSVPQPTPRPKGKPNYGGTAHHGAPGALQKRQTGRVAPPPKPRYKPPKNGGGGGGGGGKPPKGGGGGGGKFRGGRGGGGGGKGKGGNNNAPMNARKYANAVTQMQYGSLINELRRQQDELGLQNDQNKADMTGWWSGAADLAQQAQTKNAAATDAAQQRLQGDIGGIIGSLGGAANPAATSIGGYAALAQGALQGIGLSQSNYDQSQRTLVGQEKAQSLTNLQNVYHNDLTAISGKISDTLKEKGFAYTKNLFDAQQTRLQQLAAIQNMQIAGQQWNLNKQLMQGQVKNQNIVNKSLQKQLKGVKTGKGMSVGDRLKMSNLIMNWMYGTSGEPSLDPQKALAAANRRLKALGPKFDPRKNHRIYDLLMAEFEAYKDDYNALHPNHPYGTP